MTQIAKVESILCDVECKHNDADGCFKSGELALEQHTSQYSKDGHVFLVCKSYEPRPKVAQ